VTSKGPTRDANALGAQYLENGWPAEAEAAYLLRQKRRERRGRLQATTEAARTGSTTARPGDNMDGSADSVWLQDKRSNIPDNNLLNFYILNATSLAKPNAVQQLGTDLKLQQSHIAIISETWFSDQHTNDVIDGFLTHRTNGRAIGTVLPIGSRIWEIDWYQNEWPWPLFRGRIKVTSTVAVHLTLNISETVRDRGLVPKDYQ